MKKKWSFLLVIFLVVLSACNKSNNNKEETTSSSETTGMVVADKAEKKSDIINNMIVGNSKISFNNNTYDIMSEGNFNQNELWGTFVNEDKKGVSIQIDAFDNTQPLYGELSGYELEGVKWADQEIVQYLIVMEEAIQYSKDNKTLMYKARTGDILFSVTMFSDKKLTEEDVLELKALAKGIKIEYAGG